MDNRPSGSGLPAQSLQFAAQSGMERYRATAALFRGVIVQLDAMTDSSISIEHHRPSQLGDLAGTQTGFDRQQDHDAVALRVTATASTAQGRTDLLSGEDFSLFARHSAAQYSSGSMTVITRCVTAGSLASEECAVRVRS